MPHGGNHGRIVRAQAGRGEERSEPIPFGQGGNCTSQTTVAGHASADDDLASPDPFSRPNEFCHEAVHNSFLKRGCNVGHMLPDEIRAFLLSEITNRGLDTTEAEVQRVRCGHGPGKMKRLGVSLFAQPVYDPTPGIPQAQKLGHLVESLAGGIITGLAQERVATEPLDRVEAGVSPRYDEAHKGEVGRRVFQEDGAEMSLQMVDSTERDVQGKGERLGGREAHEERSDQAGPTSDSKAFQITPPQAGVIHGFAQDGNDLLQVIPACQFGHNAPIGAVGFDLRVNYVGDNVPAVTQDRDSTIVTGTFNAKDIHDNSELFALPRFTSS